QISRAISGKVFIICDLESANGIEGNHAKLAGGNLISQIEEIQYKAPAFCERPSDIQVKALGLRHRRYRRTLSAFPSSGFKHTETRYLLERWIPIRLEVGSTSEMRNHKSRCTAQISSQAGRRVRLPGRVFLVSNAGVNRNKQIAHRTSFLGEQLFGSGDGSQLVQRAFRHVHSRQFQHVPIIE